VGNLVLLSLEVRFKFIRSFWPISVLILYEGVLGGATYGRCDGRC
jgi:hypothetical protein